MNTTTTEMKNEAANALEYVSEQCSSAVDTTKDCIEDKPVASTLITFGAGFAIGVAIAAVVGQSESNRRNSFANSVSNQVMNGLSGWMPRNFRS